MEEDALMDDAAVANAQNSMMPLDGNMDAQMDSNLDDLFGDAADELAAEALAAAMPSPAPPPPPSLVLRMMDMQTKGCCTKLAWANTGSIAQIKDDGRKIVFRALSRNLKTGAWSLTDESPYPITAAEGVAFEHLQFSGIGIELAVVDSRGLVQIYTLIGALGKMRAASSNALPGESWTDLDAVVGMHWLPLHPMEVKIPYITPVSKTLLDKWETSMRIRDSKEPYVHHAIEGRHALLYVTRDAKLTLMYQNEQSWQSTSTRLESMNSSVDLVSHAAMSPEGESLLLVTHDIGKRMRLYKIAINWNKPPQPATQGAPPNLTVAPTFEIGHLTMLDHVAPQQAETARLSELHMLPRVPQVATGPISPPSLPTVMAVFTRATLPTGGSQQAPECFSVTARWNVETVTPTLHEAFAKLKASGKTDGAASAQKQTTVLRRQEDTFTHKLVLSVLSQYYGTMLAFGASDGTIEFRDRLSLSSVPTLHYPDGISSLTNAGFDQLMTGHNTHIAMSADGSAVVTLGSDGNLSHKMMALRYGWQSLQDGLGDTGSFIEAAVVCLARQYTILACSNTANDETLALLPMDLSTDLRQLFIRETIKIMTKFHTLDISMQDVNKQQTNVLLEPLLPRALSAQFVLGTSPGTMDRNFAGKFAFASLNMRLVCTAIAQLVRRQDPQFRPDHLVGLRGNIMWGSDILVYIASHLVDLYRSLPKEASPPTIVETLTKYLTRTQSPVINLLLCTWTRCYIRFLATFIPKYLGALSKFSPTARTLEEKQLMDSTLQYGTNLPFKFIYFEGLVSEIDAAVRHTYQTQNFSSEKRAELELALFTASGVPAELEDVAQKTLVEILPKFMEHIDGAALFCRDTSWIGIETSPDVPSSVQKALTTNGTHDTGSLGLKGQSKGQLYDSIRKLPIPAGAKLRRCRRCPAVMMEDLSPEKAREMPPWFAHSQRHCVCGNYWIVD